MQNQLGRRSRLRAAGMRVCRAGLTGLASLGLLAMAGAPPAEAARKAAMVIDGNTGKVLHAESADARRYPASLTKMMTLYMIFDELRAGRASFATRIRFSAAAADAQPSKLGLNEGDTISVRNAIKALITKSANDVAFAVAEHIAGSRSAFAAAMTKRARELGMSRTTFANASGLPNSRQTTTARDMLTLALHLIDDYPQHYHLFSLRSFTYKGRTYRNHNGLLSNYRGTDGLKTGYTSASGFNLVASVRRNGKHLVGAVFGGSSAGARNRKMRSILTAAFKRASTRKTRKPQLVARAAPRQAAPRTIARRPARRAAAAQLPPARAASQGANKLVAPRPSAVPVDPPLQVARVRTVSMNHAVRRAGGRARPANDRALSATARLPRAQQGSAPALPRAATAARTNPAPARRAAPRTALRTAAIARAPSTLGAQAARFNGGPSGVAAPPPSAQTFATQPAARPPAARPPAARQFTARQPAPRQAATRQAATRQAATARQAALRAPFALRGPRPKGGSYQVQVGAFGTPGEARRQIELVQSIAADLLRGYGAVTMPTNKANKRYFRARFTGFDNRKATATCNQLRRLQVDCYVTRAN